jgi:hypothetical protein
MKISIFLLLILLVSCESNKTSNSAEENQIITVANSKYELFRAPESKALLILFPGGATSRTETKNEFKMIWEAPQKGISVLLMDFKGRLWIEDKDAEQLTVDITEVIEEHNLNTDNIFIGGMSIGGTVALSLSNFLSKSDSTFKVKGVFAVDAPIDLYALYKSAQKDLLRKDFSGTRLAEPKFIVRHFEDTFGEGESLLESIQKVSPVTMAKENIENISNLKEIKLRLYTEPDTLWWKENRQTDFESTNAYVLQQTTTVLTKNDWNQVELIETKDKGYRFDGKRNPHSWSIVDVKNLITWILE